MSAEDKAEFNTDISRTRTRRLTTLANAKDRCEVCGTLFSRHYNHKAHMETHDPNRQLKHRCPRHTCNRAFNRNTDLERHENTVHLKKKDWKCVQCGNMFGRKDTLRR
ncbi:uncharacterized protein K452DRAFT_224416 [Aplosporella prunicola CBS 121167]|uniref:C2H2-type domain-containing protein n=1 Tax=Aplosporella prunicola CBS 121167 TaxID=1176127 RepID=A0A6A6BI39_9PEZI|nr:uncharacterized protein K452DRAFT_224416 [Aplosporella prunicola CBS 121167]KAF2143812.1 hypothetical protein K452DRAFT_224416 [Aplosporella prunicola CBS 121167]